MSADAPHKNERRSKFPDVEQFPKEDADRAAQIDRILADVAVLTHLQSRRIVLPPLRVDQILTRHVDRIVGQRSRYDAPTDPYAIRITRRIAENAIYGITHGMYDVTIPPRDRTPRHLSACYHPYLLPLRPSPTMMTTEDDTTKKTSTTRSRLSRILASLSGYHVIRRRRRRRQRPDVLHAPSVVHSPHPTYYSQPTNRSLRHFHRPKIGKARVRRRTTIIVDAPFLERKVRKIRRPSG
jgi:hypothetical protein